MISVTTVDMQRLEHKLLVARLRVSKACEAYDAAMEQMKRQGWWEGYCQSTGYVESHDSRDIC